MKESKIIILSGLLLTASVSSSQLLVPSNNDINIGNTKLNFNKNNTPIDIKNINNISEFNYTDKINNKIGVLNKVSLLDAKDKLIKNTNNINNTKYNVRKTQTGTDKITKPINQKKLEKLDYKKIIDEIVITQDLIDTNDVLVFDTIDKDEIQINQKQFVENYKKPSKRRNVNYNSSYSKKIKSKKNNRANMSITKKETKRKDEIFGKLVYEHPKKEYKPYYLYSITDNNVVYVSVKN